MPRGGARVGAGRPGKVEPGPGDLAAAVIAGCEEGPEDVPLGSETPLEYMLKVMNDPKVDQGRRDRLAVAAAPYVHAKVGESGKKEQKKEAAKGAASGKFAPAPPPKLVVNNR